MFAALLLALAPLQEPEVPARFAAARPYSGKGIYDRLDRRPGSNCRPARPWCLKAGGSTTVAAALRWLARTQKPDGSWDPGREDFRAGVTGLALLAFVGAGHTHACVETDGGTRPGDVIRRALEWILQRQDLDGGLSPGAGATARVQHAIVALAVSEAYAVSESFLLREPAERAILHLLSRWTGDPEPSVWGWGVLAFESARSWDFAVRAGRAAAANVSFAPGPIAIVVRHFLDRSQGGPLLVESRELLLAKPPRWKSSDMDFHAWYWGTLALFKVDGPGGPQWKAWAEALKEAIPAHQNPDGSWDSADRWAAEGGRAYATAINTLTLQVPRRFAAVFGTR